MVQLGLVSYPLYLWHWPILSFLRITALTSRTATEVNLAVAAACVLATLTKLLIEDPIRTRLELGFSRPWRARSTVAGSVLCLGVVGAAGWATQQGLVFGEKQASGASWSGHGAPVFRAGRCFLGDPSKTYRDFSAECMPAPKAAGLDVLVWGDSYGATFFSSLDSAVRASGGTLAALASSRCPPVLDVEVPVRVNCRATNEFVRQYIEQHHVTTVVLAANWVFSYFQSATSPSLTAIDHTVDTLFDLGVKNVVVAGQLPMWRYRLSVALMKSYIMRGLAPPQDSNQWILPDAFTTDAMLSQHFAGGRAKYVSLLDVACPRRTCPLFVPSQNADHVLWTFDNGHPTFEATVRYVEQMGSIIVPRRD
ncbi:MAG TPA: SGNH hydrolase domain-containing protein [Polyangiales bacterium]